MRCFAREQERKVERKRKRKRERERQREKERKRERLRERERMARGGSRLKLAWAGLGRCGGLPCDCRCDLFDDGDFVTGGITVASDRV